MRDIDDFDVKVVDSCAVCINSPLSGKGAHSGYCKRVGGIVTLLTKCEEFFERSDKKYNMRTAGWKSARRHKGKWPDD